MTEEERFNKALQIALNTYNRCVELEEIIEMFCLDAEDITTEKNT